MVPAAPLYHRVGREHGRFSLLSNTQKCLWNLEQLSHFIRYPSSQHTWPKGTKRNITLQGKPYTTGVKGMHNSSGPSSTNRVEVNAWTPPFLLQPHLCIKIGCCSFCQGYYQHRVWIHSGDALRTNVSGPYHPWTQHCHVSCIVANLTSSVSEVTQLEPPFPELLEWLHSQVVQKDSGSLRFSSCMYFPQTSQSWMNKW